MTATLKYPGVVTGLDLLSQGKTRNIYTTDFPECLLIEATNRLSTHNVVHLSPINRKGEVLTALTVFWHKVLMKNKVPNHIIAFGREIYEFIPRRVKCPADFHLRAVVVKKAVVIPVEFIYRRFLCGSLWHDYYTKNVANPYGVALMQGLPYMHRFSAPVFTPTQKSEHDEPMLTAQVVAENYTAYQLGLNICEIAEKYLTEKGVVMIDTKFEFGRDIRGKIMLVDEFLTLDSSRFSQTDKVVLGEEPPWMGKEPVRRTAAEMWGKQKKKSPLTLTREVCDECTDNYLQSFQQITGYSLDDFQAQYLQ